MPLYANGELVSCPRCSGPLPGWRREVLSDGTNDRIVNTIQCPCGWETELERFFAERRPTAPLSAPGSVRASDPPTSHAAASWDFGGRLEQVLAALREHGPMDSLAIAAAVSAKHKEMDAGQASRRALDLVKRGAVVVVGERVNARGSRATVYAAKGQEAAA